jgi:hypothetical protein
MATDPTVRVGMIVRYTDPNFDNTFDAVVEELDTTQTQALIQYAPFLSVSKRPVKFKWVDVASLSVPE